MKQARKSGAKTKAKKASRSPKKAARALGARASKRPVKAAKKRTVKARKKPGTVRAKAKKGLSIMELFQMKKAREQAAQDPQAWKQRKELPPQEIAAPAEDLSPKGGEMKKSGFGGARHH